MPANEIFALPDDVACKRVQLQEMLRAGDHKAECGGGNGSAQRRKMRAGDRSTGKFLFALRRSKQMGPEQSDEREGAGVFGAESETATQAGQQVIAPASVFYDRETKEDRQRRKECEGRVFLHVMCCGDRQRPERIEERREDTGHGVP